jgi:hypothetical protein
MSLVPTCTEDRDLAAALAGVSRQTDYRSQWTYEDQAELRRTAEDAYLKQLEVEPVIQNR